MTPKEVLDGLQVKVTIDKGALKLAESPFKSKDAKGRVINDPRSVGWTLTFRTKGKEVQLSYFQLQEEQAQEVVEQAMKDLARSIRRYHERKNRPQYWATIPVVCQSDVHVLRAFLGKDALVAFAEIK